MKLSDATLFSVSPMRLLEFIVPYPFGPTWRLEAAGVWCWRAFNGKAIGLFSTLFAGFLAPMALVRLRRSRAAGLSFARWLLAVGLAVAILPSLFPHSWMQAKSPLPLRNPEKLVVAAVLALAIFAARGFEEFLAAPPRRRALLAVGGVFAAAALAAALAPAAAGRAAATILDGTPRRAAAAAEHLPGALAEAGLLWMATVLALTAAGSSSRPVRAAAVGILALVTIVPCARIPEISLPSEAFAPTRFAGLVRRWDPGGSFRVLGEAIYRAPTAADLRGEHSSLAIVELPRRDWIQHTQALWERGTVFNADFDSGDLSRVESLRRVSGVAAGFGDAGAFFGNLSLRWGIRMTTQTHPVAGYVTNRRRSPPGLGRATARPARRAPRHELARRARGPGSASRHSARRPWGIARRDRPARRLLGAPRIRPRDRTAAGAPSHRVRRPGFLVAFRASRFLALSFHRDRRPARGIRPRLPRVYRGADGRGTSRRRLEGGGPGDRVFTLGPAALRFDRRLDLAPAPAGRAGRVTAPTEESMRRRLAGIVWVLLLCAPGCSRRPPIRSQVERDQVRPAAEWLQLEPVRLLRDYIRIDTTSRGVGEEEGSSLSSEVLRLRRHRDGGRLSGTRTLQRPGAHPGPPETTVRSFS